MQEDTAPRLFSARSRPGVKKDHRVVRSAKRDGGNDAFDLLKKARHRLLGVGRRRRRSHAATLDHRPRCGYGAAVSEGVRKTVIPASALEVTSRRCLERQHRLAFDRRRLGDQNCQENVGRQADSPRLADYRRRQIAIGHDRLFIVAFIPLIAVAQGETSHDALSIYKNEVGPVLLRNIPILG